MTEAKNQKKLLKIIVEEYVKTAEPVGSGLVVEKYLSDLSSATVRNYMAELENEGLIGQPHTSAGRVPTLAGYQYYVDNFLGGKEINNQSKKALDCLWRSGNRGNDRIKCLAKKLAELSGLTVLVGFSAHDVYYTGISNLFAQPEFVQRSSLFGMSAIIDHLDETMGEIFHLIDFKTQIMIGQNNPFGEMAAAVLGRYENKNQSGLIGILGPNRMDYQTNKDLIDYSLQLLNQK